MYKCIKANTSAISCTYHQLNQQQPHKRAYLKWRFRKKEVRRMGQKQKRLRQKERQDWAAEQEREIAKSEIKLTALR